MFDNLGDSLPAALDLTQYLAYVMGVVSVWFGTGGMMKLSTDPRSNTLGKPLGELFFGGILMSNGFWLPMLVSSFTEDYQSTANVLSYLGSSHGASAMEQAFKSVISFTQFLGIIAVMRGVFHLKRASNPTAQHGGEDAAMSGLMFIVFGSFAANMMWTLKVASSFLGFPLPSFLL